MGPLKLDENTTFSELTKKIILKTKHNSQMKKLTDVLEVPDQRLYNLEISRCLFVLPSNIQVFIHSKSYTLHTTLKYPGVYTFQVI